MLRCQPFLHWIWSTSTIISGWKVETDYTHNAKIKHYETRDLVNFQEVEYNWTLGHKLILLFFQIKCDKNKFKSRLILSWTLSGCRDTRWGTCVTNWRVVGMPPPPPPPALHSYSAHLIATKNWTFLSSWDWEQRHWLTLVITLTLIVNIVTIAICGVLLSENSVQDTPVLAS